MTNAACTRPGQGTTNLPLCRTVLIPDQASGSENVHEAGAFAMRAAMEKSVTRALQQMAGHDVVDASSPALMRLLDQI